MIGRIVSSAARAGIRAGGQPAPSGPPKEFSAGGKAVAWFLIIGGVSPWWRPALYLLAGLAVVTPFLIAAGMSSRHRPAPRDRNAGSIKKLYESWQDKP